MNLLLCIDDASGGKSAVRMAEHVAAHFKAEVDVLPLSSNATMPALGGIDPARVRRLTPVGSGEQAIRQAYRERRYDLVIVVPMERRGLARVLFGSRVGSVIQQTPATMMIARGMADGIRHIAVGISASPNNEYDVRLTSVLALAFGAKVTLVHVMSQVPLTYTGMRDPQARSAVDLFLNSSDPAASQLHGALRFMAERGIEAEIAVRDGLVADELRALCRDQHEAGAPVDLLVLGAHARSSVSGIDYYEDITVQVAQTVPVSVLIVHSESDWSAWTPKQ
jgi:nucleotide-binding universal stress UspA family protein